MTLAAGTRVGPYNLLSVLGVGGMGEVYRARDTKLNRDVALKVLPEAFASDHDRLTRLRREAQVLASLNHPHIAAIYGLEEANGKLALVLELVEGESLDEQVRAFVERLLERRPDIRVVRVPGASHFLPMEAPDEVRREVRAIRDQTSEIRCQKSELRNCDYTRGYGQTAALIWI